MIHGGWILLVLRQVLKPDQSNMSGPSTNRADGPSAKRSADARFSSFQTDPRFRLPSSRKSKTKIDKRFAHMLKDEAFTATSRVDRYGRKLKSDSKKKALERLYQKDDDEEESDEPDDDAEVRRELRAAKAKYDPARGGGFAASESDSDSSSDDEEDEEGPLDVHGSMQRLQNEQAEAETGEVTSRIAIVNLDWDHIKAVDLFALFSSFLPADSGRVERVDIYPSEFGKARMAREELEGPPREIFKHSARHNGDGSASEDDSDDEEAERKIKEKLIQEGDDEEFDHVALRSYQLDRLRYYYAVMTCSDKKTAKEIYDATDGREYQASSNLIDLRFIPDDVTFDEEPKEVCDKVPDGYKAMDFITDALQHSKVKLTWDMTPDEMGRKDAINRKFKGTREELEKNDLRAYLASDSESDEGEEVAPDGKDVAEPKLTKKELARRKMREALGLTDEPEAKAAKDDVVGDMQITFTAALTGDEPEGTEKQETTIEKYKRKEKERKERRRERAQASREGRDPDAEPASDDEPAEPQDLGFDDPFFTAEEPKKATKSALRKEERRKKREERQALEATSAAEKTQLELLMVDEGAGKEAASRLDHFDMNEIVKAEKQKKKKKKYKSGDKDPEEVYGGLQQDFKMDVDDDRFAAVFTNHEFAIDPSNPKFKATDGMKKLLEQGRKKRKAGVVEERPAARTEKKARMVDSELGSLVQSVKRKSSKH